MESTVFTLLLFHCHKLEKDTSETKNLRSGRMVFDLSMCAADWENLNAEVRLVQGHLFVLLLSQQNRAASETHTHRLCYATSLLCEALPSAATRGQVNIEDSQLRQDGQSLLNMWTD